MKRYIIIICIGFMLFPILGLAQQKKTIKSNSKFNFTEVWVWAYSDSQGKKGEMAIYREPKLNYWLLTPDDAGFRETDEMSLWFILKPNGEVLQAYQDGEMNSQKKIINHQLHTDKIVKIPYYWQSTGVAKKIGNPDLGFPSFTGKEYKVSYEKTNDRSVFYLAGTKADFSTLAHFNNLDIDAKLPIRFPQDIPRNIVPLSENSTFSHGGTTQFEFKYISPTEYHINISEFKVVK